MYGLKALQADGLVAQRQEGKPAVQMRNSVDTYNRFRSQPLLRAKPMVELAPKRMGSTYFNTFMAVPTERPSNLLLLLLHLQQAQEQALVESQAHGEAGTQEDGQHILQHLHGRPLTPVPNLTVV